MKIRLISKPTLYAIILGLALAGCATVQPTVPQSYAPVFYPPLPNPPRIQHLASFAFDNKMMKPQKKSPFADFVLGKASEEDNAVRKPYGVALHKNKLYVVDTQNAGYAVYDMQTGVVKIVTGSGPGRMNKPINITIGGDGIKYVTDTGLGQVLAFDEDDRFILAYGDKEHFTPGDVAIYGDRLYVSDLQHKSIHVLDKASGKMLSSFGKDYLYWPTNMDFGSDGNLYVADTGNFAVLKFTPDGKFINKFGEIGSAPGQFARPKGIALDAENRIYVVDAAFENVQIFDGDGRLLLYFGGPGETPDGINLPAGVTVDYESAALFQKYAAPGFKLEYVIAVTNQLGGNKVSVFGFGKMDGAEYPPDKPVESPKRKGGK